MFRVVPNKPEATKQSLIKAVGKIAHAVIAAYQLETLNRRAIFRLPTVITPYGQVHFLHRPRQLLCQLSHLIPVSPVLRYAERVLVLIEHGTPASEVDHTVVGRICQGQDGRCHRHTDTPQAGQDAKPDLGLEVYVVDVDTESRFSDNPAGLICV